jgi:hypothetical protein
VQFYSINKNGHFLKTLIQFENMLKKQQQNILAFYLISASSEKI